MLTFCCCDNNQTGTPNLTADKTAGDPIVSGVPIITAEKTDGPAQPPNAPFLNMNKNVILINDNDSDGVISVGDMVQFSVPVCNTGTEAASGVTFTDPAPTGITFVAGSASTTKGSVTSSTASNVSINVGTLAPGECATVIFMAQINSAGAITNTATADGTNVDEPAVGQITFSSGGSSGSCECVPSIQWAQNGFPNCRSCTFDNPNCSSCTSDFSVDVIGCTNGATDVGSVQWTVNGVVLQTDANVTFSRLDNDLLDCGQNAVQAQVFGAGPCAGQVLGSQSFTRTNRQTCIGIQGRDYYVNGQITHPDAPGAGPGSFVSVRTANGIFDDENPTSRARWDFHSDGAPWDPQRNVDELCDALPSWQQNGASAITVSMQGGCPDCSTPGYMGTNQIPIATGFDSNGNPKQAWLDRLEQLLCCTDKLGIAVYVTMFYFGQAHRITGGEAAVRNAVYTMQDWFLDNCYSHVMIELGNEIGNWNYALPGNLLNVNGGLAGFISDIKDRNDCIPVGFSRSETSGGGTCDVPTSVTNVADFINPHGNTQSAGNTVSDVNCLAGKFAGPLQINEDTVADDFGDFQLFMTNGYGVGYYNGTGIQHPGYGWTIAANASKGFDDFFDNVDDLGMTWRTPTSCDGTVSTDCGCNPTTNLQLPCSITSPTTFNVDTSGCATGKIDSITWYADGVQIGTGPNITIDPDDYTAGSHDMRVVVSGAGECAGEILLDRNVTCQIGDTGCVPGCALNVNWPADPIVTSAVVSATTTGCAGQGLVKFYLDGAFVEQDQPTNANHTYGPGFDGAGVGSHLIRVCIDDTAGNEMCCDERTYVFGNVNTNCPECIPTTDLSEPCASFGPATYNVNVSGCQAGTYGTITWYVDNVAWGNSLAFTVDPIVFGYGNHDIRVVVEGAGSCAGETLLDVTATCNFSEDQPPPAGLILCDDGNCEPASVGEDMHTRIINKFNNATWGHPFSPNDTSHGTNCSIHVTHKNGCQSCSGCDSLGGVGTERIYFTQETGNSGGCGSNCNIEYDHLFFRAYVFYANNFDPRLGGKMPVGLAGGNGKSGGGTANGCEGWSGRVSFDNLVGGNISMNYYMYGSMQTGYYGRKYQWSINGNIGILPRGQWNCIEGEYKMNSIGQSNGILRGWINGVQAVSATNVEYRTCPGLGIDHWFFSSFYGGCGSQYAPTSGDQHAWFDNFAISTERIGCNYEAGCQ